ncbi:hypothetical protein ES703_115262 [subsurface metagenome]
MFYVFSLELPTSHAHSTPYDLDIKLAAGVIHQVDVLFQDECAHKQHVQIFHANHQLWPSNRGADLRGNATVISFREFYELAPGESLLTATFWYDSGQTWKEVIIQIGLLPKRIMQPISFEELLAAAVELE